MLDDLQLDQITEPHAREVMRRMLNLVETLSAEVDRLKAEVQQLRDENNRLKGEQGRPKGLQGRPPAQDLSSEAERRVPRGRGRQSKNDQLPIDREVLCPVDPMVLPPDAQRKGTVPVIVQYGGPHVKHNRCASFPYGASRHRAQTLDTAWRAGRGATAPAGAVAPLPAQKIDPTLGGLAEIPCGRPAIGQRLMRALGVVELEIATKPHARLARIAIVSQVDLLILHTAPQTLRKDVVKGTPFAIHADLDACGKQRLRDLRAREVTALIGIPNLRRGDCPRLGDGSTHKPELQCLIEGPTDDVATIPIEHGHQVEPAVA